MVLSYGLLVGRLEGLVRVVVLIYRAHFWLDDWFLLDLCRSAVIPKILFIRGSLEVCWVFGVMVLMHEGATLHEVWSRLNHKSLQRVDLRDAFLVIAESTHVHVCLRIALN